MKARLKQILDTFHAHNSLNLAQQVFGFDTSILYDALVVAPGFTPMKLIHDDTAKITILNETSYIGGYLVEKHGHKIAWIKTASGASNCIDHMTIAAELSIKKLIFVGAVGALTEQHEIGDVCTPSYSISGGYALTYLKSSIHDFKPFERIHPNDIHFVDRVIKMADEVHYKIHKTSVFCTDSIAAEYVHLDEIKAFGTELIEMETAAFYALADLMALPAIALLVVSDNSASGKPLVGRNQKDQQAYDDARKQILPNLIYKICEL